MPALFKDFGKSAKDLLSKNYGYENKVSLSTKANDATFDAEWTKGSSKLETELTLPEKRTFHFEANNTGHVIGTLKLKEIAPGAVLKIKSGTNNKIFVSSELSQDLGAFHADFDFNAEKNTSVANASALISRSSFLLGGSVQLRPQDAVVSEVALGLGYFKGKDFELTARIAQQLEKDEAPSVLIQLSHNVDSSTSVAAKFMRSLENGKTSLEFGGTRKISDQTTVGLKINNTAQLGMYAMHSLNNNVTLTQALQLDTGDLSAPHKFGLTLKFKH